MIRTLLLALAVALVSTSCTTADAGETSGVVAISRSDCGSAWHPDAAGPQDLRVTNRDSLSGEVQIVGASGHDRGVVYAEVDEFAPGTTAHLHVRLGAGAYALRCLIEDQPGVTGPTVRISGAGRSGPGIVPVTHGDLIDASIAYARWVTGRLPGLLVDTRALQRDLSAGDLAGARASWLRAHLDYERLGAAYDAFGEVDTDINGLPYGLPDGVHDQGWHGFHAIEQLLWSPRPDRARLAGLATALVTAEKRLRGEIERHQIEPLTLAIRAHEVSENALQFQLTGLDDFGSHSSLDTVRAGLDGTLVVLRIVRPVLASRMPHTAALSAAVRRARATVSALIAHGHHRPGALTASTRRRLDAAIGGLTEKLAPVAAVLEPRRTE